MILISLTDLGLKKENLTTADIEPTTFHLPLQGQYQYANYVLGVHSTVCNGLLQYHKPCKVILSVCQPNAWYMNLNMLFHLLYLLPLAGELLPWAVEKAVVSPEHTGSIDRRVLADCM